MDTDAPQDSPPPATTPVEHERDEPFKRIGCTILTILIVLLLICSIVYFFSGLAAMIMQLYETIVRDNPTLQ